MSSSQYIDIAILGRQPELGLVELESLLGAAGVQPFGRSAALVSRELEIDRLGGVLKLGEVLYRGPVTALNQLPVTAAELPMREGKTVFALSAYGFRESAGALRAAGLGLKKRLRERGSVRLVVPANGLAVNAAELRHNQVLEHGFELLVVAQGGEMAVARTTAVQDIDWYSRRDYERPARSAKVGMLPPKLAQVLVNTTRAPVVCDPFCGTGVVLQEALLMGRRTVGSDLAADMVAASRTNLAWLAREAGRELPEWDVSLADAREARLPADCAVVSEGYLGPNLVRSPTIEELAQIRGDLLSLYWDALSSWAEQLRTGAEVSLCVPAWRVNKRWEYLGLVDEVGNLGYTLKGFQHVRPPLLYAREDQIVGRQLLLLRKR